MRGSYDTRVVRATLREFGFEYAGDDSGHEIWMNGAGRKIKPVLRKHSVPEPYAWQIDRDLSRLGACSEKQFLKTLKRRNTRG